MELARQQKNASSRFKRTIKERYKQMTIPGISIDGWPIAPEYQQPAPLVRVPKQEELTKVFKDKLEIEKK
jgi:hypothetical protein